MSRLQRIDIRSEVDAPIDTVWRSIASPAGVSGEMWPYVRKVLPRSVYRIGPAELRAGHRLGPSMLLLFGLVPIDCDDLRVTHVEPGRRVRAESVTLALRSWRHERALRQVGERTEILDRVVFRSRLPLRMIPGFDEALRSAVAYLFRHRHRRLHELVGPAPAYRRWGMHAWS
ncbi:SRPBCC family protein [Nocardia stercoris]|uniref:SRPBCC family protein n=1 Tax=Nocardia stercoris TaxID=2483361 RepID=A0A3M2L8C8_9NOCA|nr:hypothetical protein [Nocardia stercoris]RMI32175.1 hypothetical protein EBN03_14300 [Nocardia stercoris]